MTENEWAIMESHGEAVKGILPTMLSILIIGAWYDLKCWLGGR